VRAGAPVAEEGWDQKVVSGAGAVFRTMIAEHHYAMTKGAMRSEELAPAWRRSHDGACFAKWRGGARRTIGPPRRRAAKRIRHSPSIDEWNIWQTRWFAASVSERMAHRVYAAMASLVASLRFTHALSARQTRCNIFDGRPRFTPVSEGAIAVHAVFQAKLTP
jgi:hypothetical protein